MRITMTHQSFRLTAFQNLRAVHDPSVTKDTCGYTDGDASSLVHGGSDRHLPNLAAGFLRRVSSSFYNDVSEVLRFHTFNLIDIGELHHAGGGFKTRHYRLCQECLAQSR